MLNNEAFLKDLFKVLVKHGITAGCSNQENAEDNDIISIFESRKKMKTRTVTTYKSETNSGDAGYPDPHITVDNRDFNAYALVSKSGYTLCLDASTFERQSGFFSEIGLVWKAFDCIEDAMEWLCVEVPKKSPYRKLQIASSEYLLKYGGFWFKSGYKCDPDETWKWVYEG